MNEEWKKDRIQSAINGTNPMIITEMKSGYAVIGDTQFLKGYCVLLPNKKIESLNELEIKERSQFLTDMTIVGDAIQEICKPYRLNYEILGNKDRFLHAHIFPRYLTENEENVKRPVWIYSKNNWTDEDKQFVNMKDGELLRKKLREKIEELKNRYYEKI